jgi:peptidyl-prolyl cis-trans isomerase SurA
VAEIDAPGPTRDPAVKTVAADPTMIRSEVKPKPLKAAGLTAARVGDEIITLYELDSALAEELRRTNPGRKPSKDELNYLAGIVLGRLIERSLVVQEAKRELKDAKKVQQVMDFADKYFREEELPALLRQTATANERELKEKLADQGRSLAEMKENFRLEFLAQSYVQQKLLSRLKVELPQMRDYYNAHLQDFVHPAQVTWREVEVSVEKFPSRAAARQKAEMLLARLRRGEDFAAVSQAESNGSTKKDGGLWPEMARGSYGVPAVNEALESLPLRQLSPVLEGPSSFHIVRVEARREAGPSTFAEVQDKIKQSLLQEIRKRESAAFLQKLRARTTVTTIFAGTASDPARTSSSSEL